MLVFIILGEDFLRIFIMVCIEFKNIFKYISIILSVLSYFLVHCLKVSKGEIGFCACKNHCSKNEGDCDYDYHCQVSQRCRSNKCPTSLGFDSNTDCCHQSIPGDEDFCTTDEPCKLDEGHCDGNDECSSNLVCGLSNCPDRLAVSSAINCCEHKGKPFINVYHALVSSY